MSHPKFPGWRYGPKGEAAVFESEADVPAGWHDHPLKHEKGAAKNSSPAPAKTEGKKAVLDAHGHPHSPEIHAATASQTKEGLWRMKVGVKRPDPAPGYPLDL